MEKYTGRLILIILLLGLSLLLLIFMAGYTGAFLVSSTFELYEEYSYKDNCIDSDGGIFEDELCDYEIRCYDWNFLNGMGGERQIEKCLEMER